jgi:hypothetical protein
MDRAVEEKKKRRKRSEHQIKHMLLHVAYRCYVQMVSHFSLKCFCFLFKIQLLQTIFSFLNCLFTLPKMN